MVKLFTRSILFPSGIGHEVFFLQISRADHRNVATGLGRACPIAGR